MIPVTKPTGIAVGLGGVWAVEHRGDSVVRIDPNTDDVVARIRLGDRGPNELCGMCVENVIVSDGSVWTANNEARSIGRIDPATNELAATIELPLRACRARRVQRDVGGRCAQGRDSRSPRRRGGSGGAGTVLSRSAAERDHHRHDADDDTDRDTGETDPVCPGAIPGAGLLVDDLFGVSDRSEIEDPA